MNKNGSCHLFRHTMATLMLENGADIRYIQAMLGHVELSTTEIYTQVSIKKLKAVHTLTHPAKYRRNKKVIIKEAPKPTSDDVFKTLADEEKEDPEKADVIYILSDGVLRVIPARLRRDLVSDRPYDNHLNGNATSLPY